MLNVAVARNTTALPLKRSATMPRCGSAEKVITSDSDGLCSRSCSGRGSAAPNRVVVMKWLMLGVSIAARSHGSAGVPATGDMAAISGGLTITVVSDEEGITLAVAGRRGMVEPIGRTRAGAGVSSVA